MQKYILSIIGLFTSLSINAQCVDNGNYWNQSWVSCTTSQNPNSAHGVGYWIMYDFSSPQYVDSSHVWNANRPGESGWGAKDVVVDYSEDGTTWMELGSYTFPRADESTSYQGFEGPNFNGVFVEKILFTILSTHEVSSCASLAEIQFKIDQEACYGIMDECGLCDGPGAPNWYIDVDGDGKGDPNNFTAACEQPDGYVEDNTDPCDNGALGWGDIAPLFEDNGCTDCHGNNAASGLDLRSFTTMAQGGNKCGTNILTGDVLVSIITIDQYDGCSSPIGFPSMNDRVGGAMDAEEIAMIQAWINGGAPENCTDYCKTDDVLTSSYPNGAIIEHKVADKIIATNLIPNSTDIIYNAGNQIDLNTGFEVEQGGVFLGKIEGCGTAESSGNSN